MNARTDILRSPSHKFHICAGFALAATAMALIAQQASAGTIYCGDRTKVVAMLAADYREQPNSVALTGDGRLLEVLTNDEQQTWSILLTDTHGQSCIVATGESWQNRDAEQSALEPQL